MNNREIISRRQALKTLLYGALSTRLSDVNGCGDLYSSCFKQGTSSEPRSKLSWGYFSGMGVAKDLEIEGQTVETSDFMTFVNWENPILNPELKVAAIKHHKKVTVFWEADDKLKLSDIANGEHDPLIRQFAIGMVGLGGTVYPFPEINTDWSPQSLGNSDNSLENLIISFGKIKKIFHKTVPDIRLGLNLNCQSFPNKGLNVISGYQPVGKLVDVIGLDGFNHGVPNEDWTSCEEIFSVAFTSVKDWGLPIELASIGCAPDQGINKRGVWIADALKWMNKVEISHFGLFGENKQGQGEWERNWSISSDKGSKLALKTGLK